eukprot:SAG31_NODE_168_length_21484_cov_21.524994_12_plen_197_part_00
MPNSQTVAVARNATNATFDFSLTLSSPQTLPDQATLTFSSTVTTGIVSGAVSDSISIHLGTPNTDIAVGQVVSGIGITDSVFVLSTSGTCDGTDDGAGTTAIVSGRVSGGTTVVLAPPGNSNVLPGLVVSGDGISTTVTVVAITGICTGTDDGSNAVAPVACANNDDDDGCAVLAAGNNCMFSVTAVNYSQLPMSR